MTVVKTITETPAVSNLPQPTSKVEAQDAKIPTDNRPVTDTEKKVDGYHVSKEIRDWVLAAVFLIWGGQSIFDRNFKPDLNNENFKAIVRILDKDGDGKLSNEEINEAKQFMEEIKNWKKIRETISGFTGKNQGGK